MSRTALLILLSASIAGTALMACSGPEEVEVEAPKVLPTTDPGRCPIKVPGTKAVSADTAQGIEITFTTETGDVDELRRRVNILGEAQNTLASKPGPTVGREPDPAPAGNDGRIMKKAGDNDGRLMKKPGEVSAQPVSGRLMAPLATATVSNVDNGAKVLLVPAGGTVLTDLKAHVASRVEAMQGGACMISALDTAGTKEEKNEAPAE